MLTFPGYCTRSSYGTSGKISCFRRYSLVWAHATLENYPTGTVKPLLLPKMKGSLNEGTGELRTIADSS